MANATERRDGDTPSCRINLTTCSQCFLQKSTSHLRHDAWQCSAPITPVTVYKGTVGLYTQFDKKLDCGIKNHGEHSNFIVDFVLPLVAMQYAIQWWVFCQSVTFIGLICKNNCLRLQTFTFLHEIYVAKLQRITLNWCTRYVRCVEILEKYGTHTSCDLGLMHWSMSVARLLWQAGFFQVANWLCGSEVNWP